MTVEQVETGLELVGPVSERISSRFLSAQTLRLTLLAAITDNSGCEYLQGTSNVGGVGDQRLT